MEQGEWQHTQAGEKERIQNERDFHGELSKWGERISLALFVSLVIQGLVAGTSIQQVLIGLFMTGVSYYYSLRQLKASKPF
jgi:hypothetical protein